MDRSGGCVQKFLQGCLYISHYCISWSHVYYSINSFLVESRKYRRGLWQPWASRLSRYPNGILLWSVVLLKYGLLDFCCIYHLKLLFNFLVSIPNTKDLLEITSYLFLLYILVPREVLVLAGFAVTLAGTGIWG